MASELGCESSPPPTKRPKIAAFKAENGPNLCQTQLELCLENSNQSRNQSESSGNSRSPQSWFMPSSEVSAMSCDEPEGVDSGFSDSATPTAYISEDSQEASTSFSNTNQSNSMEVVCNDSSASNTILNDEDSILEDAVDLNLPHEDPIIPALPTLEGQLGPEMTINNDEDDRLSEISGLSDLSGSEWKATAGPFSWVQRQMMSGADPRELLTDLLSCDAIIPDHFDQITLWKLILNMVSEPPRRKKLENVNTLSDVVQLIRNSRRIIILTGAGVSVSCGIPDFRSRDGVYARLAVDFPDLPDPQAMFDIHYFRKDPRPFFKFAREIYPGQFQPSPCHKFIRCVEKHGKLLRNYTQNIDTLEQVVGIENVIQCHGSFATATCMKCKHKVAAEVIRADIFEQNIPKCTKCSISENESLQQQNNDQADQAGPSSSSSNLEQQQQPESIMKPDIVFFGEGLGDEFHQSVARDKEDVDLLIMIGSSLKVRPVALIPSSIDPSIPQVLINREPLPHLTPDVELLGDCDGIINQICHMLGQGWDDSIHKDPLKEISDLLDKNEDFKTQQQTPEAPEKSSENSTENSTENSSNNSTEKSSENSTENCEETKPDIEDKQKQNKAETSNKITQPSNEELAKMWQSRTRQSIAQKLKPGEFLFVSPSRYVFPGAEVYDKDDDDSSSSSSDDNSSDADSDDENSDMNDKKADTNIINTDNTNDTSPAADATEVAKTEDLKPEIEQK